MRLRRSLLVPCVLPLIAATTAVAQAPLGEEAYLAPPALIQEGVLAPWHENTSLSDLSPEGGRFLVERGDGMPTLAMMARPWVSLGETELDPVARRSRRMTTRNNVGIDVFHAEDGTTVSLRVPNGARVSNATWSPDGSQVAFFAHFPEATHVYVADPATGAARAVTRTPVLATLVGSFQWSADGGSILVVLCTDKVKGWPEDPFAVATEPQVRTSRPGRTPSRTYRFLMQDPQDQALYRELITGQLALVDVASGREVLIGDPAMIQAVDMSPDASWFRVTTVQEPFSYFVPARSFGSKEELWNLKGEAVQTLSERELWDTGGRPQGPPDPEDGEEPKRSLEWRPDGAGLSFLQREPAPAKEEEGADDDDAKDDGDGDGAGGDDPPAAADADDGDEEGDDEAEEEKVRKDRVMLWKPPFGDEDVEVVLESEEEIRRVQYSEDAGILFLSTTVDERPHIHAVRRDAPDQRLLMYRGERGSANRGGFNRGGPAPTPTRRAPPDDASRRRGRGGRADDDKDKKEEESRGATRGSLMTRAGPGGVAVVRVSPEGAVYFSGTEDPAEEEDADEPREDAEQPGPPVPYLDQVGIDSGEVTALWQGEGELLERLVDVDGDPVSRIFTTREAPAIVPDHWLIDLPGKEERQLTHNQDFTPWYHDRVTERFEVERVDGFRFWVRITRDPDFGERLPGMFWFYPREYTDQDSYSQRAERAGRPSYRFERPSTRAMSHLIRMGYVVIEPDLPIVGPDGRMNDNFIPDLRNGLYAVINECDRRRLIDRDRLAIGGHSYGAFGTANALAHTPFFRAGIAGDGCFNRTLTPMSFQAERRYLWDARETYVAMSPLLWANQVNGALLMYHGAEDNNTGTFPINSERMFQALDGLGKPCAMYMYPYEGHGPAARETVLDLWARWVEWLDVWVKHPEKGAELLRQEEAAEAPAGRDR